MKKKNVLGQNVKAVDSPISYKFDKINNKNKNSLYNIRITVPEFTSICPVTGQPDFATIIVDYVPKQSIVESKSFKLFIQSFRNYGIFHEDVTLFIGKQIFNSLKPKWIRVQGFLLQEVEYLLMYFGNHQNNLTVYIYQKLILVH